MKRRDYLLVGVVFAAIALNAHWIYGENGSLNADSILKAAPKGNFDIAMAALEANEFELAFDEFTLPAQGGNAEAQLVLATMYKRGEGVTQNYDQARNWYYSAAKQNNGVAQAALGAMYVDGKGSTTDLVEAYKWYSLARQNGAPFSSEVLGWIETQLTIAEVSIAKELSAFCVSSNFESCALKD